MFVWGICSQKYRASAFSGIGGLYIPGRWHPQGHKIVYTAESLALASLEIFVHLESNRVSLVAIKAGMSDEVEIEEIEPSQLPDNWQDTSSYPLLQEMGRDWLTSLRIPILKVPCSIVPVEYNYLLNPQPSKLKVVLESSMKFKFDRRMWKSDL
ncbi:RES domain protein (plasmid) [Stanieria cyanosphaera PCC 7437]|uniref:RES domain protein n=1 Tax=Stanieria cyanosphaera (strain ATCC 29371 / PCC 7437) TaxID=111780 RepID=K9XZE7_STAC7|nr:RES family NAD+ phosphorylase [Stanieria cyanosphaera]AFZ37970.1 RES domain protein [Stanieria cyanosphaera PCC 7437]